MGSGGSGGSYRPSKELVEQLDGSKDRRIAELQSALRQQHEWHLAQTEPDQYGLIPANEYQDSAMCAKTLAALEQ